MGRCILSRPKIFYLVSTSLETAYENDSRLPIKEFILILLRSGHKDGICKEKSILPNRTYSVLLLNVPYSETYDYQNKVVERTKMYQGRFDDGKFKKRLRPKEILTKKTYPKN